MSNTPPTDDPSFVERFVQAYIICALWTSSVTDEAGETIVGSLLDDSGCTADDLTPEALQRVQEDCEAFIESAGPDLAGLDPEQSGHDFWLTRNGHGAGFWDRGLGARGDRLTELAKPYGECTLQPNDDGQIEVV